MPECNIREIVANWILSDIILHNLVDYLKIKTVSVVIQFLFWAWYLDLVKRWKNQIWAQSIITLLRMKKVVLGHGFIEDCIDVCTRPSELILLTSLGGLSVTGHMYDGKCDCSLSNISSFTFIRQSLLFSIRKIVPLRCFRKLSFIYIFFFPRKGRPWWTAEFRNRVAVQPLFAFKKRKVQSVL